MRPFPAVAVWDSTICGCGLGAFLLELGAELLLAEAHHLLARACSASRAAATFFASHRLLGLAF
jgi:hypothetical protein